MEFINIIKWRKKRPGPSFFRAMRFRPGIVVEGVKFNQDSEGDWWAKCGTNFATVVSESEWILLDEHLAFAGIIGDSWLRDEYEIVGD